MLSKCLFVFTLSYCIFIIDFAVTEETLANYGEYGVIMESVKQCIGPKKRNITRLRLNVITVPATGNVYVYGNATNREYSGPTEGRIRLWKWESAKGRYETLVTFNLQNTCEIPILKKEMYDKVLLSDSNCYLRKGYMEIFDLNFRNVVTAFLGRRFFFGKFKVLTYFTTPNENIACYQFVTNIVDINNFDKELKYFSDNNNGTTNTWHIDYSTERTQRKKKNKH